MEIGNPYRLFGRKVFGFWLPFIGFKTYVFYDDVDIFDAECKIYEEVFLVQWVVGWAVVYNTEIVILSAKGDDDYFE